MCSNTGSEYISLRVKIENVYDLYFDDDSNANKDEQTVELDSTDARDKYFVRYEDNNDISDNHWVKFYAYVPKDEGVDETKDFSKLTLTFYGVKSGQPFTVSGFTKGEDGKYFAEVLMNAASSKGTFTVSGVDGIDKWTLGYIRSQAMGEIECDKVTSYSNSGNNTNPTQFWKEGITVYRLSFTERYYTLGEGFEAGKEYKFVLTQTSLMPASGHESDDIAYTIFMGVEGAPVVLNKENNFTATVKFTSTDAVIGIKMTGCNCESSSSSIYHLVKYYVYSVEHEAQKDITVDGAAVTYTALQDITVPFKIVNFSQEAWYKVEFVRTDGEALSYIYNYPTLTVGEAKYDFKYNVTSMLIKFTAETFTVCYTGASGELQIKLITPADKISEGGSVDIDFAKRDYTFTPHYDFLFADGFDFNATYDITIKETAVLGKDLTYNLTLTAGEAVITCKLTCVKDGTNTFVFRGVTLKQAVTLGIDLDDSRNDHKLNISIAEHAQPTNVTTSEAVDVAVDALANSANNLQIVLDSVTYDGKLFDIVLKLKSTLAEGDKVKLTLGAFGAVTAVYGDPAETEYIIYGRTISDETKTVLLTTDAKKQLTWSITLREHADVKLKAGEALSLTVPKGVSADQHFSVGIDDSVSADKIYDVKFTLTTDLAEGDADVTLQFGTLAKVVAKYADEVKEYTFERIKFDAAQKTLDITTTAGKALTWSITLTEHTNPKIGTGEEGTQLNFTTLTEADSFYIEVDDTVDTSKEYNIVVTLTDNAKLASGATIEVAFGTLGSVKARSGYEGTYTIWGVKFTEDNKLIQLTATLTGTKPTDTLAWTVKLTNYEAPQAIKLGEEYKITFPVYVDEGNKFRIPLDSAITKAKYKVTINAKTGDESNETDYTEKFRLYISCDTSSTMCNFSSGKVTKSSFQLTENDYLYIYAYTSKSNGDDYVNKVPVTLYILIEALS